MGQGRWLLLHVLLVALKIGNGVENGQTRTKRNGEDYIRPWEKACTEPKPGDDQSRGACGFTCIAGNWLDTVCSGLAPLVVNSICEDTIRMEAAVTDVKGVKRVIEYSVTCGALGADGYETKKGSLRYNSYLGECVPKDWTCPDQNWDCQDPCLYSCDYSFDSSICKVLNRRTGEVGRCALQYDGNYSIGCWDTPDECSRCAWNGYGDKCWGWEEGDCPRVFKKTTRLPSLYRTIDYEYANYLDYEEGDGELFEDDYEDYEEEEEYEKKVYKRIRID